MALGKLVSYVAEQIVVSQQIFTSLTIFRRLKQRKMGVSSK